MQPARSTRGFAAVVEALKVIATLRTIAVQILGENPFPQLGYLPNPNCLIHWRSPDQGEIDDIHSSS
jgi:hypothetical protein